MVILVLSISAQRQIWLNDRYPDVWEKFIQNSLNPVPPNQHNQFYSTLAISHVMIRSRLTGEPLNQAGKKLGYLYRPDERGINVPVKLKYFEYICSMMRLSVDRNCGSLIGTRCNYPYDFAGGSGGFWPVIMVYELPSGTEPYFARVGWSDYQYVYVMDRSTEGHLLEVGEERYKYWWDDPWDRTHVCLEDRARLHWVNLPPHGQFTLNPDRWYLVAMAQVNANQDFSRWSWDPYPHIGRLFLDQHLYYNNCEDVFNLPKDQNYTQLGFYDLDCDRNSMSVYTPTSYYLCRCGRPGRYPYYTVIGFKGELMTCGADLDCSGCVDDSDLLTVLFNFGTENAAGDINGDGITDEADLLEVLLGFGQGC